MLGFPAKPTLVNVVRRAVDSSFNQVQLNSVIHKTLHTTLIPELFVKRLGVLLLGTGVAVTTDAVVFAINTAKATSKQAVVTIMKTYANAWTTSKRFHAQVIDPCKFGCDAVDSLTHYIQCERLWVSIDNVIIGRERNMCERLLLHAPTREAAVALQAAFHVYHATRKQSPIQTVAAITSLVRYSLSRT